MFASQFASRFIRGTVLSLGLLAAGCATGGAGPRAAEGQPRVEARAKPLLTFGGLRF